ncbi:hypothetical protein B0O99DRAFT_243143 [Bisporella sp. PMI_857]|nr:hypothetical protein B0O99DRAFT_243143 [Bisporella sp. PMI_857]
MLEVLSLGLVIIRMLCGFRRLRGNLVLGTSEIFNVYRLPGKYPRPRTGSANPPYCIGFMTSGLDRRRNGSLV